LSIWHYPCSTWHLCLSPIYRIALVPSDGYGFRLVFKATETIDMKKIEAIIKPYKLEEVRSALTGLGISYVTMSEVESCGRRNAASQHEHGRAFATDFCPKIKLEVIVADALSGTVSSAIVEAARTGTSGDGNIFISQVEEAVRIRTPEKDQLVAC
jgi:nitrogen regulatory protein P-II 1